MTTDYHAALTSRDDDAPRALLLSSLSLGLSVPRALASALGIRQRGGAWVAAWAALERVRGEDEEIGRACEGSERRTRDEKASIGDYLEQGGQEGAGAGAAHGNSAAARHAMGDSVAADLGADLGHLGPGRGGRETGEEEEEGEEAGKDRGGAAPRDPGRVADVSGVVAGGAAVAPPVTWASMLAASREAAPAAPAANDTATTGYSKRASEATDDGAPDWPAIREHAEEMAPGPMGWVLYQEHRLAQSNRAHDTAFPALSPFSLHAIECFFLSGKRWLLWMAGRGFGKSTLTGRLALALAFGVQRRMAPGPAWVCPIVSVLPVDAEKRLDDIQALLLHAYLQEVKIASGKATISAKDSTGNPIAFVSSASTLGNVSGPSSFAALVDEEEKILHGRAGPIVGSLAYTFRSRPHVFGFRVSSAMTVQDTLARACAKGNGPGSPLTNHVVTLGPFLGAALAGLFAVADWEEARGQTEAATAIRAYAERLTPEAWQIPTWLGHPSIGRPTEDAPWGPGDAAIATRIEAEAVDDKTLEGLPPWRYWLRECASHPTGSDAFDDGGEWAVLGEEHRNAGCMEDERGY